MARFKYDRPSEGTVECKGLKNDGDPNEDNIITRRENTGNWFPDRRFVFRPEQFGENFSSSTFRYYAPVVSHFETESSAEVLALTRI